MSSVDRLPPEQRAMWNKAIAALEKQGQVLLPYPEPDYSVFTAVEITLRNRKDRTFGVYDSGFDVVMFPQDEDRTESELEELAAERGDDDEWAA